MNSKGEGKKERVFTPGEILLSRDGKRRWRVQEDGSLRTISDQEPGELEGVKQRERVGR